MTGDDSESTSVKKKITSDARKELSNFFFIMFNMVCLYGLADSIYNHFFDFEIAVFFVLVVLFDFCVVTNLIDLRNYVP